MNKKEFLDYLNKGGDPYLKILYDKEEIEVMIGLMDELLFDLISVIHNETIGSFLGIPDQTNVIKEYPVYMHFDNLVKFYKNHK